MAVVTVFRSRLRADAGDGFVELAAEMLELARSMPGFRDYKVFTADDRYAASPDDLERTVPVRHAVHAERVDRGVAYRLDGRLLVLVGERDQQQRGVPPLGDLREPTQVGHRVRVAERHREVGGEQDADRVDAAPAQRPGGRVRTGVAQPLGRRQNALPQVRRQLVGTAVRVGDRAAGHADLVGNRLQGGPHCRSSGSIQLF